MKYILFLISICLITLKTTGKDLDTTNAFVEGKIILSAGYGYPNIDESLYGQLVDLGLYMSFTKSGFGPFHFRGEYALTDKIGIGISINYDSYTGTLKGINFVINPDGTIAYSSTDKNVVSSVSGLIRFNYHFATTKTLDPYFAVGAGFRNDNNSFTADNSHTSFSDYKNIVGDATTFIPLVGLEAVAGLRYYITHHLGIYSEMGIAKSIIQMGVSYKF